MRRRFVETVEDWLMLEAREQLDSFGGCFFVHLLLHEVRDAARMFEAAGVARTERSIINWCQPNRVGVPRLDCYYDPNDRKYFITQQSVELAIAEEMAKAAKLNVDASERVGSVSNSSETHASTPPPPSVESEGIKLLHGEIMDLKITNRAKDMWIEQLRSERESFDEERKGYIEQLLSGSRKLGELTARLLQIESPRNDSGVEHIPEDASKLLESK